MYKMTIREAITQHMEREKSYKTYCIAPVANIGTPLLTPFHTQWILPL